MSTPNLEVHHLRGQSQTMWTAGARAKNFEKWSRYRSKLVNVGGQKSKKKNGPHGL